MSHAFEAHVNTCRSGPFPTLVEDDDDRKGASNPEEGVSGASQSDPNPYRLHPEDDHDSDVEIEDGDRIFLACVHPEVNPEFLCASSTISTRLAEASAKNSKTPSFRDNVPDHLHDFADVFDKASFDSLPERRKWDHVRSEERRVGKECQ